MSVLDYILFGTYLTSILVLSLDTDNRRANALWFGYILPRLEAAGDHAAKMNAK